MQCDYFDRGECRSCTLMGRPYSEQVDRLARQVADVLPRVPENTWAAPFVGPESGFRNKAKLAVGGRRGAVTLGILDPGGSGVDLTGCGLYEQPLADALVPLRRWIDDAGLTPYDVPSRNGELKNVLVTHSPDGELMVRFVLRSEGQLRRVQDGLDSLHRAVPGTRVVTVNLLPEHRAVVEGDEEVVLTEHDTLPMRVGDVVLHLRPRSFFQTNTVVASGLYAQASRWIGDAAPTTVADLFCGVGGFALHAAAHTGVRELVGVEISPDAVRSAQRSARELGVTDRITFRAQPAAEALDAIGRPDLVVVNPPRRGIGGQVAQWLESSDARRVVYSSCNPESLARDLEELSSFEVTRARMFDMFPQTDHVEVLVELAR